MRPAFYNSAKVRVWHWLVTRGGGWSRVDLAVRWALFTHPVHGTIAIDTGYTAAVIQGRPRSLPLRLYAYALRPKLVANGQINTVLAQLGCKLDMLILSHYHADHIAGLRELQGTPILAPAQGRHAPLRAGLFTELIPPDAAFTAFETCNRVEWRGAPCFDLFGDGALLAVPLDGHTQGHFGFWFAQENLLYAVDAAWTHAALSQADAPSPGHRLVTHDSAAAARTAAFVKAFQDDGGQVVLCHDPAPTQWDIA